MPTSDDLLKKFSGQSLTSDDLYKKFAEKAAWAEQDAIRAESMARRKPGLEEYLRSLDPRDWRSGIKGGVAIVSEMGKPIVDWMRKQESGYAFPLEEGADRSQYSTERLAAADRYSKMGGLERLGEMTGRTATGYVKGLAEFLTQAGDPIVNPERQEEGVPTGKEAVKGLGTGVAGLIAGAPAKAAEASRLLLGRNNPVASLGDFAHNILNKPEEWAGGESSEAAKGRYVSEFYEDPASLIYGLQMGAHASAKLGVKPAEAGRALRDRFGPEKPTVSPMQRVTGGLKSLDQAELKETIRARLRAPKQGLPAEKTGLQGAIDKSIDGRARKSARSSAEAIRTEMGDMGPETAVERVSAKQASELKGDLKAREDRGVALRTASKKAIADELGVGEPVERGTVKLPADDPGRTVDKPGKSTEIPRKSTEIPKKLRIKQKGGDITITAGKAGKLTAVVEGRNLKITGVEVLPEMKGSKVEASMRGSLERLAKKRGLGVVDGLKKSSVSEASLKDAKQPWEMSNRDYVDNTMHLPVSGGFVAKPAVFIRLGDVPVDASGRPMRSTNGFTGKPEQGVSVYKAWYDEKTGKYVLQGGGEQMLGSQASFTERPVRIVEGRPLSDVGGDGEILLDHRSVKTRNKTVDPNDIVYEQDPWMSITGKEYMKGEYPDFSNEKPTPSHRTIVKQAHAAGKPVPAEVLKEYGLDKPTKQGKAKIITVAKALGVTALGAAVGGAVLNMDEDKLSGALASVPFIAAVAAGGKREARRTSLPEVRARNVIEYAKRHDGITLDATTLRPARRDGFIVSVASHNIKIKELSPAKLQAFLDEYAPLLDKHHGKLSIGMFKMEDGKTMSVDINVYTKTRQAAEAAAVAMDQQSIGVLEKGGKYAGGIWIGGTGNTPKKSTGEIGRFLTNVAKGDVKELKYVGAGVLSQTSSYESWLQQMKKQTRGGIENPRELFKESQAELERLVSTSASEKFPTFREIAREFRKHSWNAHWYKNIRALFKELYPSMERGEPGKMQNDMLKVYAYIQSGVTPDFAANHTMKTWAAIKNGTLDKLRVGRRNIQTVSDNVRAILRGELPYPIQGRKLRDFYRTMARLEGGESSTVIDMHMSRIFGFGDAPKGRGQYTFIESALRTTAEKLGRTPEEVQASLWAYQKLRTDISGESLLGKVSTAEQNFLRFIDRQIATKGEAFLEEVPKGKRLTRVSPTAKVKGKVFNPADESLRTNAGGQEDARIAEGMVARLNMYADHAIIEPQVASAARQVFQTMIREGRLYDMAEDPLNFRRDAQMEVNKRQYITDLTKLESHIRSAGYAGYVAGDGAIVVVFDPLKMKKVGELDLLSTLRKPIKDLWPLAGLGVAFLPYLFNKDDKDGIFSPAMMGLGLGFLARGESEGARRVSRRIDITPLKSFYDGISASGELRPGFKLPPSELISIRRSAAESLGIELKARADGALVAPKGYGKALSDAMKLELVRRKLSLARQQGVAIKVTKSGIPVPNVKKSGVMVPVEFANYKGFKDVRKGAFGGTKDVTRLFQEMDGSLSLADKAKMEGQAGPVERFLLWPERNLNLLKRNFLGDMTTLAQSILGKKSKAQLVTISRLLERMSNRAAYIDPKKLATGNKFSKITTDVELIKAAQDLRKFYDTIRVRVNEMRQLRGQPLIPRRKYYSPNHIAEVTLWERTFGLKKEPIDIMRGPELPDYIKPEAAFNPNAMAREANLPEWMREMNAQKLLERYLNTAANDMFNTTIIQNHKAFADQLESMGFPNSAAAIRDHVAESYAGVKAQLDRAAAMGPTMTQGLRWWRSALNRTVFPLNVSWNLFVQTSSSVLTYARYGGKNCALGAYDWFFNKGVRDEIVKTYSNTIKADQAGKISRQDVYASNASLVKLNRTKFETAVDAASYMNEVMERHLTGWSSAAARRQGIKAGLKGEALLQFTSDGGAKTQSMYNAVDLPGMLRSEIVKTGAPYQTFSFELFNTMRELAGQTGMSMGKFPDKARFVIRLLAGAMVVNYISGQAVGRKPWELGSFIPFYNSILQPVIAGLKGEEGTASGRALPSPMSAGIGLTVAIRKYFKSDNVAPLRQWLIKYGLAGLKIPGGTQASRMVDGIIAVSEKGVYDNLEKMKFPVSGTREQITAILAGPYATNAAQKYLEGKKSSIFDMFASPTIEAKSKKQRTIVRNMIKSGRYEEAGGMVQEWNSVYRGTEYQMPELSETILDVRNQQLRDILKRQKEAGH